MIEKVKRRKCKQCKREFPPKTTWQRFCKRNCHAAFLYQRRMARVRRAERIIAAQEKQKEMAKQAGVL